LHATLLRELFDVPDLLIYVVLLHFAEKDTYGWGFCKAIRPVSGISVKRKNTFKNLRLTENFSATLPFDGNIR
jgi:hypothetical protein